MVEACAEVYHTSGHQFQSLLEFMVGQPWFYDAKYMGNKVKTPIELLLQFQHQTGLRTYGLMCHWHMQRWLGLSLVELTAVRKLMKFGFKNKSKNKSSNLPKACLR